MESGPNRNGYYSDETLLIFLDEIGNVPLLTKEQEIELGTRIQTGIASFEYLDSAPEDISEETAAALRKKIEDGNEARDHMVKANMRLVVHVAKKYPPQPDATFMDVIQDGTIGLKRAAEKFDPTMNNKFSTYATIWIRQGIGKGLKNRGRLIGGIYGEYVDDWMSLNRFELVLMSELGREPTDDELSERMGIALKKLQQIREAKSHEHQASLDRPLGEDGDTTLGDMFTRHEADVHEQVFGKSDDILVEAVEALTLTEIDDLVLNKTADEIGISQEEYDAILYEARQKLTPAESDMLWLIRQGTRPASAARMMDISQNQCQVIISKIKRKLAFHFAEQGIPVNPVLLAKRVVIKKRAKVAAI